MASVQFIGKEAVVAAFGNRNCNAFSIWQGRQFLFPCVAATPDDAEQQLEQYLEMISDTSNHVYTLKVYEDYTGKIQSKTPDDGSFNFRLSDAPMPGAVSRINGMDDLRTRMNRIEELLENGHEAEEEETTMDKVAGFIENNTWVQPVILGLAEKFLGYKIPAPQPAQSLAGHGTQDAELLQQAIDILKKRDSNLGAHMMKLAKMDDATFNYIIGVLDKM